MHRIIYRDAHNQRCHKQGVCIQRNTQQAHQTKTQEGRNKVRDHGHQAALQRAQGKNHNQADDAYRQSKTVELGMSDFVRHAHHQGHGAGHLHIKAGEILPHIAKQFIDIGTDFGEHLLILIGAGVVSVNADMGSAVIVRHQCPAIFRVGTAEQIQQLRHHLPAVRHPMIGRVIIVHYLVGVFHQVR